MKDARLCALWAAPGRGPMEDPAEPSATAASGGGGTCPCAGSLPASALAPCPRGCSSPARIASATTPQNQLQPRGSPAWLRATCCACLPCLVLPTLRQLSLNPLQPRKTVLFTLQHTLFLFSLVKKTYHFLQFAGSNKAPHKCSE